MGGTRSNNDTSGPKRRLDLGNNTKVIANPYKKKPVENPYKKNKKSLSIADESSKTQNVTKSTNEAITASSKAASVITPELSIEKFFVKDTNEKPTSSARRQLVPPSASDEKKNEDLYYHSDDSSKSKNEKDSEYHPDHIHGVVDYQKRGDNVSLTTGQMNAYRFIRNHFNIPKDIELDSKFGPWSGICFEERIIRAYTLSQLVPRNGEASSFKVCTYCGEEGHKRDACIKLI